MMVIDEQRMYEVICARKPSSVALNGPEGLITKMQTSADHITEKFGIPAYIIGDTCWGSCDLNTQAADMLGAEILFNIGHTITNEAFGKRVIMINAYDDVSFDSFTRTCATYLNTYSQPLALSSATA